MTFRLGVARRGRREPSPALLFVEPHLPPGDQSLSKLDVVDMADRKVDDLVDDYGSSFEITRARRVVRYARKSSSSGSEPSIETPSF